MQDLNAIMESRPEETQESPQRDDGRDDQGRFVAQAEPAPPQLEQEQPPQAEPERPPPGYIPQQAFDARMAKAEEKSSERYSTLEGQLQNAMQQLASFQQQRSPQEPVKRPDFYENPDAAIDLRLKEAIEPISQSQRQIVEDFSRMIAAEKHGQETVDKAFGDLRTRVNANPDGMRATYMRIMQNHHPYGELVRWHKEQSALTTYGDDPEAYIKAEVDRRLSERAGQQQQPPTQQAQPVLPTPFAGARNAGPSTTPAYSGPRPLSEIMPH